MGLFPPTDLHRFSGLISSHRFTQIYFLPQISQIYTDLFSPTDFTDLHGLIFCHRFHGFSQIFFDYMIFPFCVHLCKSVGLFPPTDFTDFHRFFRGLFPPTDFHGFPRIFLIIWHFSSVRICVNLWAYFPINFHRFFYFPSYQSLLYKYTH